MYILLLLFCLSMHHICISEHHTKLAHVLNPDNSSICTKRMNQREWSRKKERGTVQTHDSLPSRFTLQTAHLFCWTAGRLPSITAWRVKVLWGPWPGAPRLHILLRKGGKGWRGPGDPSLERCTDLTIFKRLRGAVVIHHAAGLLFLCRKKQRSEYFHLYRKRKNEKSVSFQHLLLFMYWWNAYRWILTVLSKLIFIRSHILKRISCSVNFIFLESII